MPGLYDAHLAVELSGYLFGVQMERYQDKHPRTIFPSSTTYNPPQLPAHIQVILRPVSNSPSNEELKAVQTALRISENLANVTSMFDADLSMNLSRHLFDIQFGRYLQKARNREYDSKVSEPASFTISGGDSRSAHGSGCDPTADVQNHGRHDEPATLDAPPADPSPEILSLQTKIASLRSEISTLKALSEDERYSKASMDDARALLARLCDGTEDIKQTLVGTRNCMARGINRVFRGSGYMIYSYSLINAKGETPESVGLPSTSSLETHMHNWVEDRDHDLARYLRFYSIGEEIIDEGIQIGIKAGNRDKTKALLRSHLGFYQEYRRLI